MVKEEKNRLRDTMRGIGRVLTERERESAAEQVIELIERWPRFAAAGTVGLYCALPDEFPTMPLIRKWCAHKRIVLPAVEHGEMIFREYMGRDDLTAGAFGIPEPQNGETVQPSDIDIMLVPGVAFDLSGCRLGRGKGFYDRYLSSPAAARIYKVGVCLPHRIVDAVPSEPHDMMMDEVVTSSIRI